MLDDYCPARRAREIRRHLLRSFLTILGIVIGVFSVITMVTLGNGATQAVRASISALGSDVLQVRPGQSARPRRRRHRRSASAVPPDRPRRHPRAGRRRHRGRRAGSGGGYRGPQRAELVDDRQRHQQRLSDRTEMGGDPRPRVHLGRGAGRQERLHHRQYDRQEPVPGRRSGRPGLPHQGCRVRGRRRAGDARTGRVSATIRTTPC